MRDMRRFFLIVFWLSTLAHFVKICYGPVVFISVLIEGLSSPFVSHSLFIRLLWAVFKYSWVLVFSRRNWNSVRLRSFLITRNVRSCLYMITFSYYIGPLFVESILLYDCGLYLFLSSSESFPSSSLFLNEMVYRLTFYENCLL